MKGGWKKEQQLLLVKHFLHQNAGPANQVGCGPTPTRSPILNGTWRPVSHGSPPPLLVVRSPSHRPLFQIAPVHPSRGSWSKMWRVCVPASSSWGMGSAGSEHCLSPLTERGFVVLDEAVAILLHSNSLRQLWQRNTTAYGHKSISRFNKQDGYQLMWDGTKRLSLEAI